MFKRDGIYIFLCLIDVVVWQKSTQYCKAIILQLKIKKKKKEYSQRKGVLGNVVLEGVNSTLTVQL